MRNKSELLMTHGTTAHCHECGETTLFVPVDENADLGWCEFCCTGCDSAVFLLDLVETGHRRPSSAVA
jgi:hypothetical protein